MLSIFLASLGVVCTMLIYAVPGFLLIKSKLVKEGSISAFAKLLMYVCSPCLVFSSVTRNNFSSELVVQLLVALVFISCMLLLGLLIFHFVFKKKSGDIKYRIYNLATTFANCAFMGVPVLEALFPDYPQAIAFSAMFSLAMNVLGWSVGSFIISKDKKYISVKKILLNPATIALVIAVPFFVFGLQLPYFVGDVVSLLAKMTTPLCMLIMGMRLATVPARGIFLVPSQYLIIAIKQIVFPLATLLLLLPLPLDPQMKSSIYIMMCCPVASVVLNFAEMIGQGQRNAANLVLLGTSLSVITIPVMSLLITLF
ncbi:MAG: AEC family transporter [Clostridia bacterium]|nr:AEC family transporter [Clostridia bacterium]